MNILTQFIQLFTIILALAFGCSLARQGVITGRAAIPVGAFDLRLGGRRVVLDLLQFRDTKVYYRLAILPAI